VCGLKGRLELGGVTGILIYNSLGSSISDVERDKYHGTLLWGEMKDEIRGMKLVDYHKACS